MAFTFFYRDAPALELAIEHALPALCGRAFIHVWDAGCAHGPEPYTVAILLRERMSDYVFRNVHLHATDIDPGFAAQVSAGVFAEAEVKRVPPEILQKYFRPASSSGCVEVVPELRARVTFTQHDLLSLKPVREGLSLIVCKNVLLHFDEAQRIGVLEMFHQALQPNGILVMEHTQKLPERLGRFYQRVAPHVQVYRKVDPAFVEHTAEEEIRRAHRRRPANVPGGESPPDFADPRRQRTTVPPLRRREHCRRH